MSRTRWASSERPATSASSGSVQSISTTWTPTSSALTGRASSDASATMDRSVRLPDSATTARRNWGADWSATGEGPPRSRRPRTSVCSWFRSVAATGHDTPPVWQPGPAGPRAGSEGALGWCVGAPAIARSRHGRRARGGRLAGHGPCADRRVALVAPTVRDVGDHRVLTADELALEPLRRLVVEQPVPPVAGDVLRQHDDRRRCLLVRRPGHVEDVEVRDHGSHEGPVRRFHDDERHARQLPVPSLAEAL